MRRLREASRRVGRQLGRLGRAAEGPWAPAFVFAGAICVWWIQAYAMPLAGGRDFGTYLGAYAELFRSHPIDLGYVLGRTPVAPLLVGGLLDPFGGALAEPGMSVLYGATITAWFLAGRTFGGRAALLVLAVLLLYPGYGILMHELSSDPVFAVAFAGWSLLAVRVVLRPRVGGFALLGVGVALLVLVRPGNQALLVLALVPLAVSVPWRTRVLSAFAFFAAAVALLGAWTVHNGVRYGDYTVARGGNARLPFERVFLTERIVRPENGPASRRLAAAVQRDLLPHEPYRSYGVHLADFFSDPSPRMIVDLEALANARWGWANDARILRDVGIEAVSAHPGAYARGVALTVWGLLHQAVFRPVPASGTGSATVADSGGSGSASASGHTSASGVNGAGGVGGGQTITIGGRTLPLPTEGERIPAPYQGGPTSPDGSIYTVWTSPTEHHLVFVRPGDAQRFEALQRRMGELASHLPDRGGHATLVLRFDQASRWFVPPIAWLVLGIAAIAVRRPRNLVALTLPTVAGLVTIVLNALAITTVPHYAVPVAPAFVLLAAGALFGPTSRVSASD